MERVISEKLEKWLESPGRKPLLIRGARQVGKTWAISDFGKKHFPGRVHSFNFEKNPGLNQIFEVNLDPTRILNELELTNKQRIIPGKDLVFFDEIQDCPKAIMALRYFYEEKPDLHILAAGSLIEFALKEISFPVGRIQTLIMQPMSFHEFLMATGNNLLAEKIKLPHDNLPDSVVQMINMELNNYFIVGGMPESVQTYLNTKSFMEAIEVQNDLITTFRQDFSKYAGHSDKRCLNHVLTGISGRVGKQIKYSHLSEEYSQPTIKKAFDLLETARLFSMVPAASPSGIPLKLSASDKKFKVLFLDIGLLSAMNGFFNNKTIDKLKMSVEFRGMMAEQFVGQELRCAFGDDLFYWGREARGSNAEIDFLTENNGNVCPIEVKSGSTGRLTSLHLLLDAFPGIQKAIVFTANHYGALPDRRIEFLPLFEAQSLTWRNS